MNYPEGLDSSVCKVLDDFLGQAQEALGKNLEAAVLFGSAAEGRMRASSDVNLALVLDHWPENGLKGIREAYAFARTAIQLDTLFLLKSEIDSAVEAFAVKFDDIARRHAVIFGTDFFAGIKPDRESLRRRLKQILLNLRLRFRHGDAAGEGLEHSNAAVDAAGPLRSAAAALAELEGKEVRTGREALASFCSEMPEPGLRDLPDELSRLREGGRIKSGDVLLNELLLLTVRMEARAEAFAGAKRV